MTDYNRQAMGIEEPPAGDDTETRSEKETSKRK